MAYIDPEKLAAAGLTDEVKPRPASAVISIAGEEGTGKTHWALTAPKPLFYMSTDYGDAGVVEKAKGQIIRPKHGDFKLDIPMEYRAFVDKKESSDERQAREGKLANYVHEKFYVPFYQEYEKAIKLGVRSVVWDNAVDVWEYTRLSVYGRNATNRDDLRSEANAKFREMVRLANVNGIVLVMINHLQPKFESYYDARGEVKWKPSATEKSMQGFDKAPFLVTANLWTSVPEPGKFKLTVKKCRDNANLVGQTYDADPFEELMAILIPSVEDWS